jgi:hypothetical protein
VRMFGKYKKKLEKRYKKKESDRLQLNFVCDVGLVARLRLLAKYLDTPIYPVAEHVIELGMSEVAATLLDSALVERLQRHLLQEHLLVGELDPEDRSTSVRADRIRDAFRLLELIELKAGGHDAVVATIERLMSEV